MRYLKKLAVCAFSLILLTSCGRNVSDAAGAQSDSSSSVELQHVNDVISFASSWDGTVPANSIEARDCIVYSEETLINKSLWYVFIDDVNHNEPSSINIISSNVAYTINYTADESQPFEIEKSVIGDDGGFTYSSFTVSSSTVTEKIAEGKKTYLIGDCQLFSESCDEDENSLPFECEIYRSSSKSSVSYPFEKIFSSLNDFENYYNQYNEQLELDDIKSNMIEYDNLGSFNNHIVFLYADMEGSESVKYTVSQCIKENGQLTISLIKSIPLNKSGEVGKWQVYVKIPSEYLDDISPDNVNWSICYNEQTS